MRVEDGFCGASGLKKRKAQQHRVAHARPDRLADVRAHADAFYQNGVNRYADDDEKTLKSQREQGMQIVLPHAARFPVEHRRHRDRRDGSGQIDLNHPPVHNDENADRERPHGKARENALEPQPEQGAEGHRHEPRLKVCRDGADADGRVGDDVPAALLTTLCATSNMPITIFHVLVTMRMAQAVSEFAYVWVQSDPPTLIQRLSNAL